MSAEGAAGVSGGQRDGGLICRRVELTAQNAAVPTNAASRSWLPPTLLVAAAAVRDIGLATCLLVLPAAPSPRDRVESTVAATSAAFGVAVALLLVLGTVLAFQSAGRDRPRLVGWYTVALLILAALGLVQLSLWGWPSSPGSSERADASRIFNLLQALVAAHASSLLIAATLRAFGSRLAPAWTIGVSVSLLMSFTLLTLAGCAWIASGETIVTLLPCFPLGAALALAWLLSVRREESGAPLHEAAPRAG